MVSISFWLNHLKEKESKEGLTPFERFHYKMMRMKYDPSYKEIGDRVMIWDTSLLVNYETNDYIESSEEIFNILKQTCVVVGIDETYEVLTNTDAEIDILNRIFLDLIVFIPEMGIKVRTHSDFVRIL